MKRLRLIGSVMAVLFAAVTLQACSDDDDDNIRMDNQTFVTEAASSNMFEIEAGEMAVVRGNSADVKEYGGMMVVDHGATGLEMRALVGRKGWDMPDNLLPKHQQMLDRLDGKTGAEFDREFVSLMVTSHEEAVKLFSDASESNSVSDGDLKRFAGEKLPGLRHHLEEARDLAEQVND